MIARRDIALAAALAVIGQLDIWVVGNIEGPPVVTVPCSLLLAVAVAFRRRAPVAATGVALVALALQDILGEPAEGLSTILGIIIVSYTVAAELPRTPALLCGSVILAGLWAAVALSGPATGGDYVFTGLIVAAPWLVGRASRATERKHAEQIASERRRHTEEAVGRERVRIGRELHDIVAHSVSVMVVHAGVLRQRMNPDGEEAAALRTIETTGRDALAELRRLLHLLRTGDEDPELAPQPGLQQLEPLVERFRDTGLEVDFAVDGTVGPGTGLAAYRIVQEGLTNVLKHGRHVTAVKVTVAQERDRLLIEVEDDGAAAAGRGDGGHGLIGMRERAALYGGSVTAGPRPEGGWHIRAELPTSRL